MTEVKVESASSLERALKFLKRKMDREGTLREIRERKTFKKKSRINYDKKRKQKYKASLESQNRY